jgi:hypothetical protein
MERVRILRRRTILHDLALLLRAAGLSLDDYDALWHTHATLTRVMDPSVVQMSAGFGYSGPIITTGLYARSVPGGNHEFAERMGLLLR